MPHGARLAPALVISLAAAACGGGHGEPDSAPPAPDAAPDAPPAVVCDDADPAASLRLIPGVLAVTPAVCGPNVAAGATCFEIDFDQLVDHTNVTESTHFVHKLELAHRGCDAPTLVADWGYDSFGFFDIELSVAYQTNTLWVEHRFQGASIPQPEDWDWTQLTIENGANDLHAIVSAFRQHYTGRWVSTGASKGGITATYYKYFFPDDVDGSVPYVAPASRARSDTAYQDRLDTALPQPCSQNLRDAQVAALTTRKPLMIDRLTPLVGAAQASLYDEYISSSIDWGFWQLDGVQACGDVPGPGASDDAFWAFFRDYSGISGATAAPPEPDPERSYYALTYEWLTEQGFAFQINSDVYPLLTEPSVLATMEDNFIGNNPGVTLPPYDGTVTAATRAWVRDSAADMVLIYGQYDPWSGGAMDAPTQPTSGRFFVPNAPHSAQIRGLGDPDHDAAIALITPLFGREPSGQLKPAADRAAEVSAKLIADHEAAAILRWRIHQH